MEKFTFKTKNNEIIVSSKNEKRALKIALKENPDFAGEWNKEMKEKGKKEKKILAEKKISAIKETKGIIKKTKDKADIDLKINTKLAAEFGYKTQYPTPEIIKCEYARILVLGSVFTGSQEHESFGWTKLATEKGLSTTMSFDVLKHDVLFYVDYDKFYTKKEEHKCFLQLNDSCKKHFTGSVLKDTANFNAVKEFSKGYVNFVARKFGVRVCK